jgi:hypothetical protein
MQAKRQALKDLSRQAMKLIEMEQASTVNEALVMMYAEQGHTEIHSFKKWMELGYCVQKGEKALLLWGEPKKAQKQEKVNDGDPDEFKFFPLAYVFSQKQVAPLKELAR